MLNKSTVLCLHFIIGNFGKVHEGKLLGGPNGKVKVAIKTLKGIISQWPTQAVERTPNTSGALWRMLRERHIINMLIAYFHPASIWRNIRLFLYSTYESRDVASRDVASRDVASRWRGLA